MGISITADEAAPIPRPVTISFTCDGHPLCSERYTTQADYVEARSALTKLGWIERATDRGRSFLCQQCKWS